MVRLIEENKIYLTEMCSRAIKQHVKKYIYNESQSYMAAALFFFVYSID